MDHEAGMVTSSKSWTGPSTTASMTVSNLRSEARQDTNFLEASEQGWQLSDPFERNLRRLKWQNAVNGILAGLRSGINVLVPFAASQIDALSPRREHSSAAFDWPTTTIICVSFLHKVPPGLPAIRCGLARAFLFSLACPFAISCRWLPGPQLMTTHTP